MPGQASREAGAARGVLAGSEWPAGQAAPRTAVAFQSHLITPGVVRQFERLRLACPPHYEIFWLMHVPAGTPKPAALGRDIPHHFVTTPEIRTPDYPGKSAGGPQWSIWADGHTDLTGMHFFRRHPGFDQYWFIEYDVRFSGRWERFFAAFERNGAALLTTSLRSAARDPTWWIWDTLKPPPISAVVPGFRWETDRVAGFMPIFRASRQALRTMDDAYREGWTGHCEATWPTILRGAGLAVEDIGGDGEFVAPENRGRFYSNSPTATDLSPGTLVFRPAKSPVPRLRRNRLWHPVKPLDVTFRINAREQYWELLRQLRQLRQHLVPQALRQAPADAAPRPPS